MLVIFDLGLLNFTRFDQVTDAGIWFLTRTVTRTEHVLCRTATLHDQIVRVGATATSQCRLRCAWWNGIHSRWG